MSQGYRRCCGIDVHQETVVVCVLPPDGQEGELTRKVYQTFRRDLIRLRVWLKQLRVTEIAMESTGVYWIPVWNLLEDPGFRMLLAQPTPVKALQGRQTTSGIPGGLPSFSKTRGWTEATGRRGRCASCGSCCGIGFRGLSSATRCITKSGIYWKRRASSCRA